MKNAPNSFFYYKVLPAAVLSLLIFWLIGVTPCGAQLVTTGGINGSVRDQSGATVPGAKITITDVGTGTSTQTVSNGTGSFSEAGLEVGTYEVVIGKTGFNTFQESGIYLGPAAVRTVNAVLKPGRVVTTVNVQASAAQVQTSTSEISSQVSEQQVEMLPLNGRNFQGLSALMPGVANLDAGTALGTGGYSTYNAMSINGLGGYGSLYTLDGIWDTSAGNLAEVTVTPNPDQIEEVRVLQNNFSVKYSLMGGSVVLIETKSGTDTFHGGAWDYLRNDAFDARNFFSPTVPGLKQNIFGADLGGPFYIPGVYNTHKQKTFFYWNTQWVRSDAASALTTATPTQDMRNGVFPTTGPFATTIKNPLTGQPFPNNTIPASMLNSNSSAFLNALYPLPNNPAGGFENYINLTPDILHQRDDEARVDQNITPRLRLMAEYFDERQSEAYAGQTGPYAGNFSIFPTNHDAILGADQMAQIQLTQILSPSMVNQTSIATSQFTPSLSVEGTWQVSQVPGFSEKLPYSGFLSNRIPEVVLSEGWANQGDDATYPIKHGATLNDTVSDNWNWLRGKHFLEAGALVMLGTARETLPTGSNGAWSFTGLFTGNPVADFLIGDAASFSQSSTEVRFYAHYPLVSPYFQDRWRATRRLTITAGLRMSYMPFEHDQPGFAVAFDAAKFNPAEAPIVNPNGTITPTPNYNPENGIIFNGVNGVPLNFTNAHDYYWLPSVGFAWDVFGNGRTALRGGYGLGTIHTPASDCSSLCPDYFPSISTTTLITPTFPNPTGAAATPATVISEETEDFASLQADQIQSYSLSLEHQFGTNWYVSAAEAGDIERHLPGIMNINQPVPFGPYDFNPEINSGTVSEYYYAPYTGKGSIGMAASDGVGYWNALELDLRHPVGHNLFLTAAYTWSHNLSDNANISYSGQDGIDEQDPYNLLLNYGNSTLNTPQVFTTSLIYSLPWFQQARGWKGVALGGWQYSDISTIQSGSSLTPGLSIAHPGLATTPDLVGGVTGPKTVSEWFNTNAFAAPPYGFYGNAAQGSILGPGLIDFDMAFYKNFRINERNTIQFRAEFFNIFNHTNFRGVSTALGAGNFGRLDSAADPRILEFALRYQF